MANRIVFYGPVNNNKRNDLLKLSIDYVKKHKANNFFYILPNRKLLEKCKKVLLKDRMGAFDLNVFTFDDIVKGLLEEKLYTNIDLEIKEIILQKTLKGLYEKGEIKYYKNMIDKDGFIEDVSYIIGEIKRSLLTPEEFNKNTPDISFYKEIGLIYNEYEKFLNDNNLLDTEESFLKSLNVLKDNTDYFKNIDFIIIDEFFDFKPQELELLREMIKQPLDIYINIPYKRESEFTCVKETLKFLQSVGFEIVEVKKKEEKNLFEVIGDNLFLEKGYSLKETDNITLIKAANKYIEIKRICQEIKILYNKGVPLKDIGIVITDSQEYLHSTFNVFKEEGIPCFISEEIPLIDMPLVKEFLNIIELKMNKFNKESIIKRIKNSYFNIYSGKEKDKVEYILYSLNYNNINELKTMIMEEGNRILALSQDENVEEKWEELNYLMDSIESLNNEGDLIPDRGGIEEIVDILIDIIDSYNIIEKINKIYRETEDYSIFHRDMSSLSKLKQVLERIKLEIPLIYNDIDLEDFYNLLLRYLEREIVIGILGDSKGVNILTIPLLRGLKFQALFITGLVEGKYPKLKEENFFFKEDNYYNLKKIGFNVENFYEKLDKESLGFVIAITRCTKLLYLSYPENSLKDEVNIPSIFLDELISLFPEEKINIIELDMDYLIKNDFKEITTEKELINHLLYRYFEGEEVTNYIKMLNSIDDSILAKINEKVECEIYRNKEEFNKYNGFIGDRSIEEDLKLNKKDSVFSITHFETYGKCPYKFLMERILKLEGMERFVEEFTPLDKGNIFHQVLKDYYSLYRKHMKLHIMGEKIFEVENTLPEINKRIEKILENNGIKTTNKLWCIRIENMSNTILNLIKKDLDRLSASRYKMVPYDFEVEFGYIEDFSLDTGNEKLKIFGKIDRIDKFLDFDKYILYDYKTSSYGIKKLKDMNEGISFQLPVYIMSQKHKDIISGGYIDISKTNVHMELVKENEKELVNKKRGNGILDKESWDMLMRGMENTMQEYIESIYRGDFSINPKECDKYCPYIEVCRYNFR